VLNPFYNAVAWLIVHIHDGMAPIFGKNSGASWALSIVLLTIAMRLLLFPLFVKQIKNQRAMNALQPKMKELQAKYKNDKEKLNQEMMALWKEHGANPLSGCLPLLVQMPVFFALFRVLNALKPDRHGVYHSHFAGIMTAELTKSAGAAKVFGVPIAASFSSSKHTLDLLHASGTSVKVLSIILIVLMGASTFLTQRQLLARSAAQGGAEMPQQQKTLLYVLPVVFAVFGFKFPLGVLLYWLTTNLWSLGQQGIVIKRMDATAAAAAAAAPTVSGPAPGAKPSRPIAPPATAPGLTASSPPGGGAPATGSTPGAGSAGTGSAGTGSAGTGSSNGARPGGANRRPAGRNKRNRRRR
jgi:YidC/Oxa1 family membrane protein insertase